MWKEEVVRKTFKDTQSRDAVTYWRVERGTAISLSALPTCSVGEKWNEPNKHHRAKYFLRIR